MGNNPSRRGRADGGQETGSASGKHRSHLRGTGSVGRVLRRPMEDVHSGYSFGRELGRGQFGVTSLVTHKATGEKLACKSIATRKLTHADDLDDVRREVQIMHHLTGHRNIVELKGAYEDRSSVYLVMELCEGGELFDRIISRGHYSERAAAFLCREIVNVVHCCHSMGVMHRDLKPENFLFLNTDEDSPLKATDFGLSTFFKPDDDIPKPDASLAGVSVQSLSRDGVLFHSKVSVSNPYPVPIPIFELAYTLKSAGRVIVSGKVPDPVSPAASVETMLELPVTVPYDVLMSLMRDLGRDWDIDYELEMGLTLDLPVAGNFTIPLSTAGEIKLPTLSDMF